MKCILNRYTVSPIDIFISFHGDTFNRKMLEALPTALDIQAHEKSTINRLCPLPPQRKYTFRPSTLNMSRCRDVLMDSESKMECRK